MRTAKGCRLLTSYRSRDGTENLAVKTQLIPAEGCIEWGGRTPAQVVKESCADWPQNGLNAHDLGDCCWQWVED